MAHAEVTIIAHPPPVLVSIDGRRITGMPRKARLKPGTYTVVLEHPSCGECKKTIKKLRVKPDAPRQTARFSIQFKPATLIVNSDTSGTVWYGQSRLGRTGRPIRIDMRTKKGETRKIRIEDPETSQEIRRQVKLIPGETTRLGISF